MARSRIGWLCLVLLADATAFKFLSNFKAASLIPRPSAMLKRRKAAQKFGNKKLAVITGASSGLGLETAARLLRTGEYHVLCAVRDLEKMRSAAKDEDFPDGDFTALQVELSSFDSVREFCKDLERAKLNRPIERLICSAATYRPGETPEWSVDGHEPTMQVNLLSHFLMISLLLPGMAKARDPRVILVGGAMAQDSVTVYPRADLGTLDGLKAGATQPVSMLDGFNFHGAKAYKDSKLGLAMLSNALHKRYHKQTGIAFSTVYPGKVSDSALFEGATPLDTSSAIPVGIVQALADLELAALKGLGLGGGLHADGLTTAASQGVSTAEAGARLFQVSHDGRCSKSGVCYSWKEGRAAAEAAEAAAADVVAEDPRAGWEAVYEHEPPEQAVDTELSHDLWRHATSATRAEWPPAYQAKSPCPTLKVVGAVTKAMNAKEEAKRTLEGIPAREGVMRAGLGGKVLGSTGYVVDAVAGNTVGRVAKLAQDRLLGHIPTEAVEGSFQETKEKDAAEAEVEKDADELQRKLDDALLAGESGFRLQSHESLKGA